MSPIKVAAGNFSTFLVVTCLFEELWCLQQMHFSCAIDHKYLCSWDISYLVIQLHSESADPVKIISESKKRKCLHLKVSG